MSLLQCLEHGYTLKAACPNCAKPTAQAGPAKYSPEDRYGKYRRQLKLMDRAKKAGLGGTHDAPQSGVGGPLSRVDRSRGA